MLKQFYENKKVLVIGACGFKGSWTSLVLSQLGAKVYGTSLLQAPSKIFTALQENDLIDFYQGRLEDFDFTNRIINIIKPDIIINYAANGFLQKAHEFPFDAFASNVMGSVSLLACIKDSDLPNLKAITIATTDKTYTPDVVEYTENSQLGNTDDLYSTTKSCLEIAVKGFSNSYELPNIAVVRSSNVIGGYDTINTRLVPTILNSINQKTDIVLNNPHAKRTYLHILDSVFGYLSVTKHAYESTNKYDSFNLGSVENITSTLDLVNAFVSQVDTQVEVKTKEDTQIKQAQVLLLNSDKAKEVLNWIPKYNIKESAKLILQNNDTSNDVLKISIEQIQAYMEEK